MIFKVKCDSCAAWSECCVHLVGEVVERVILPRGWRAVTRNVAAIHTSDAVTFQCPRCVVVGDDLMMVLKDGSL